MDIRADYVDTPHRRLLDLRRHGVPEVPLLGWYNYTRARLDLPVHRHFGVLEISLLDRGRQNLQVENRLYRLRGGDLFVRFPGEAHSSGGYPMEAGQLYWLNLRLPKPGQRLFQLTERETARLTTALCQLPHRQFRAGGRIKGLFKELLALYDDHDRPLRTIRLRQTVLWLLLEVVDTAARHVGSETSRRIAEVIQTIESAPQAMYRLEDLARHAHLSLSQFKARFKAEAGVPPRQFILRTKVEAAEKRLVESRDSVLQIALDFGFPSSQYFATVFKRITGLTPQEARSRSGEPPSPSHRSTDGWS